MNAPVLQPQVSGSRRPPYGSDFPPVALGPDPDDGDVDGTMMLLRSIEMALDERRVKTRADADNMLALLETREAQVEQELLWSRLISPTVIRSLNGEVESLDRFFAPQDRSEELLAALLDRIHEARTRLKALLDAPN